MKKKRRSCKKIMSFEMQSLARQIGTRLAKLAYEEKVGTNEFESFLGNFYLLQKNAWLKHLVKTAKRVEFSVLPIEIFTDNITPKYRTCFRKIVIDSINSYEKYEAMARNCERIALEIHKHYKKSKEGGK